MLALLAAALSLTLDVPFLAQTDRLCGGAAAAMVFRYLGDTHADVRSFEPIVDRRAGGIRTGALVAAIERRGWDAETFEGSIEALRDRLRRSAPIVVLLTERRTTYHYVVVVGATDDAIVVHDPSWGPSRAIPNDAFVRSWRGSGFWALAISGAAARLKPRAPTDPTEREPSGEPDSCSALVDDAISRIARGGLDSADAVLESVRAECPRSAGPLRELAGVRFAQKRPREAAGLARQALAIDPHDWYAADVLGSSLFLLDDPIGALKAWNRIDRPRVDRVRIEGVRHTRQQAIASVLGLEPGDLLTAKAFARASRRLAELPDRTRSRISLEPQADGFALVDVVVAERSAVPSDAAAVVAIGAQAAVDRQIDVALPGLTGQGEAWSASWRWWANRPMAAVAFEAPRVGGIGGVWRVDASWDEQTYAFADSARARESRLHGGLTVSDWLSGNWRYSVGGGFDSWNDSRRTGSLGASIERRLFGDRVALTASVDRWLSLTGEPGFSRYAVRAGWQSPERAQWTYQASASAYRVSDAAPLGLWPGAGDGHARPDLLRAHPLLDGGVVDTSTAFGRSLVSASAEGTRWFDAAGPVRIGAAAFVDAAHARRSLSASAAQIDLGVGLRLRIPGSDQTLRVDVARGLRDGANAITVGWTVPIAERGLRIADRY